ncbi:hypothetical protein B0J12DRAFT_48302 [Macrophomina phaseolina]|uniref:Secreted protein n=1 Tax=Macrophomina phaseolina TaxID=35725 RepID=A0ABQ8GE01_9PEZI|nr:hypothetical protein B0J12DRAFT_48302 [Macrophomina phaseolina]
MKRVKARAWSFFIDPLLTLLVLETGPLVGMSRTSKGHGKFREQRRATGEVLSGYADEAGPLTLGNLSLSIVRMLCPRTSRVWSGIPAARRAQALAISHHDPQAPWGIGSSRSGAAKRESGQ